MEWKDLHYDTRYNDDTVMQYSYMEQSSSYLVISIVWNTHAKNHETIATKQKNAFSRFYDARVVHAVILDARMV
jgi:hypothetical protein